MAGIPVAMVSFAASPLQPALKTSSKYQVPLPGDHKERSLDSAAWQQAVQSTLKKANCAAPDCEAACQMKGHTMHFLLPLLL